MAEPGEEPKQEKPVVLLPHHDLNGSWLPVYLLLGLGFSPPASPKSFIAGLFSIPKPHVRFHSIVSRLRRIHPFYYYVCYFSSWSVVGYFLLKGIPARKLATHLDLFFMAVSALTSSSMATMESESFSNGQLIVMTLLMLVGGEVFTSMIDLHVRRIKVWHKPEEVSCSKETPAIEAPAGDVELGLSKQPTAVWPLDHSSDDDDRSSVAATIDIYPNQKDPHIESAAKCLLFVVMAYFVSLQFLGFLSVLSYLIIFPTAGNVLRSKHIRLPTFSIFMVVSTFANCGFVPNNEGMAAFRNNSGLLLLLTPLVLAGNTLFPPFLRIIFMFLKKFFPGSRKGELDLLLSDGGGNAVQYPHLLPAHRSRWLAATVAGFLLAQTALFCSTEWRPSGTLSVMQGTYRKAVGAWFQSVNARHSGEAVVDVSSVAPAVLVLYVVMMYLPGYTCILPFREKSSQPMEKGKEESGRMGNNMCGKLHLSHISYLSIFVILMCITEQKSMTEDPLNFSVFNIIFEVISAYGNVGFTTGYSCQRRLTPDSTCRSPSYGFVGAWSTKGKLLLMAVMVFGRLKRLTMGGGKAWIIG